LDNDTNKSRAIRHGLHCLSDCRLQTLARDRTSLVRLSQKTPIHAAPKQLSNNTC